MSSPTKHWIGKNRKTYLHWQQQLAAKWQSIIFLGRKDWGSFISFSSSLPPPPLICHLATVHFALLQRGKHSFFCVCNVFFYHYKLLFQHFSSLQAALEDDLFWFFCPPLPRHKITFSSPHQPRPSVFIFLYFFLSLPKFIRLFDSGEMDLTRRDTDTKMKIALSCDEKEDFSSGIPPPRKNILFLNKYDIFKNL